MITREDVERIVNAAFDSVGDRWYEPWEWQDTEALPEGHREWTPEAIEAYAQGMRERAVEAALAAMQPVKCTRERPWDKKTLPVEHTDAQFVGDTQMLECPHCGHCWSLGPDV